MPRYHGSRLKAAAAAAVWTALPASANACAVCFGLFDNPNLSRAFFLGAAILIGFTFAMLGGLVYAAYRIEMRRNAAEERSVREQEVRTWA